MSRQLDIQVYKLINGFSPERVEKDRFDDYTSVEYFSSDVNAMPILINKLIVDYDLDFTMFNIGPNNFYVGLLGGNDVASSVANTVPLALSKATYKYFSGEDWSEEDWVDNGVSKFKSLYNMLKELEWVESWNAYSDGSVFTCPCCNMSVNIGHLDGCELDEILDGFAKDFGDGK